MLHFVLKKLSKFVIISYKLRHFSLLQKAMGFYYKL